MTATLKSPSQGPAASTQLWAAVGVLAVAVLAMGATLIQIQTQPEEPSLAVLAPTPSAPFEAVNSVGSATTPAPTDGAEVLSSKMTVAPADPGLEASKSIAIKAERDASLRGSAYKPESRVNRPF